MNDSLTETEKELEAYNEYLRKIDLEIASSLESSAKLISKPGLKMHEFEFLKRSINNCIDYIESRDQFQY